MNLLPFKGRLLRFARNDMLVVTEYNLSHDKKISIPNLTVDPTDILYQDLGTGSDARAASLCDLDPATDKISFTYTDRDSDNGIPDQCHDTDLHFPAQLQ